MNQTWPPGKVFPGDPIVSSTVKHAYFTIAVLFFTLGLLWLSQSGSKSRLKLPGPQGIPLFGSIYEVSAAYSFSVR